MGRIIAGIDGSDGANAALRWAIDEARLRAASVEAVLAWHTPYMGDATLVPLTGVSIDPAEVEGSYRAQLDDIIRDVRSDLGSDAEDVLIRAVLIHGSAPQALLDVASGAELLVVGSRGLGGFKGLFLGSVTHQVIGHAPCPVVVVRPTDDPQ